VIIETCRGVKVELKRGAIKAYREYLNEKFKGTDKLYNYGSNHRGQVYRQYSREYGDYLYSQDRGMFMYELTYAMDGQSEGFDHTKWCKPAPSEGSEAMNNEQTKQAIEWLDEIAAFGAQRRNRDIAHRLMDVLMSCDHEDFVCSNCAGEGSIDEMIPCGACGASGDIRNAMKLEYRGEAQPVGKGDQS
jgi:hypothetical protein